MSADLNIILPEIFLSVFAMVGLLVGAYGGKDRLASLFLWITSAVLVATAAWIGFQGAGTGRAFEGMFVDDGFARFAKVTILLAAAAVLLMSEGYMTRRDLLRFEYPLLIALASVGMMVMVSAGDLIALYMGLELQSLSLYVVAALRRDSVKSTEAGLKYFVLGALSSGLLLYGASLVYGFSGTTLFSGIIEAAEGETSIGLLFGLAFICAGLAFKAHRCRVSLIGINEKPPHKARNVQFDGCSGEIERAWHAYRLCPKVEIVREPSAFPDSFKNETMTMATVLQSDLETVMSRIGSDARAAASKLSSASSSIKDQALLAAAKSLRRSADAILEANAKDMAAARQRGLQGAMLDRLALDARRVEAMAEGLETIAAQDDPVGDEIARWQRPNGLDIARVRVPLGVVGIIYESRPNVTADAGALCLKAGNAAVLRCGSESFNSSHAILDSLREGVIEAGLPEAAIQLVPTTDRQAVGLMLTMADDIDVIIPRGGRSLIERVQKESKVPVLAHLDGLCHVYLDRAADPEKARAITLNAKMRRTGICGAAETLLVDLPVADNLLAGIIDDLAEAGCEVRGDEAVQAIDRRVVPATDEDWTTEYLDAILSIKLVDGLDGAIAHINAYGSHHTDSIITEDEATAERFLAEVDSAIVMHNASTQFADGGEFGMGAEIGISTGRLHARGPVGAEQLTSFNYRVRGTGQTRPT